MTESIDVRRKRAQFRASHRGTKEMDWMLGRFADEHLQAMNDPSLQTFELLLAVADPQIQTWLLNPEVCDEPGYREMIESIRSFNNLNDNS